MKPPKKEIAVSMYSSESTTKGTTAHFLGGSEEVYLIQECKTYLKARNKLEECNYKIWMNKNKYQTFLAVSSASSLHVAEQRPRSLWLLKDSKSHKKKETTEKNKQWQVQR